MNYHTPGPWKFMENSDYTIRAYSPDIYGHSNLMGDYRGMIIADLRKSVGCTSNSDLQLALEVRNHCLEEVKANAQLITAAPQLLKAAELALKTLGSSDEKELSITRTTLENAIKKAKGEE